MAKCNNFYLKNKRTRLLRIALSITVLYGVYMLNQNTPYLMQERKKDVVKVLEMRSASLQLNWVVNSEGGAKNILKRAQSNSDIVAMDTISVIEDNIQPIKKNNEDYIKYDEAMASRKIRNVTSSEMKGEESITIDARISQKLPTILSDLSERFLIKEDLKRRKEKIVTIRRKYLFSLRYYEQLAGATRNLIDLASLAKHFNREIVMPYVNNSRMHGIQYRTTKKVLKSKFSNFSTYFDIEHLNSTLRERGYAPMAAFEDFISDCKQGLDVVVHFVYNDSFSTNDAKNWFGIDPKSWFNIREAIAANGGHEKCDFLRKSGIERLLGGVAVNKYTCVDPEIIRTAEHIEKAVFKSHRCIGIIQWKGMGNKRTHFPVPKSVFQIMRPSDVMHSRRLSSIAKDFAEKYLKNSFLAVHIRAERQLAWRGMDKFLKCTNILSKKIFQRQKTFQIKNIFLATDLPVYGSDTFESAKSRERSLANRYVTDAFKNPVTFNPEQYGIFDKGEISIIEMNILSFGESLYTLGGGKFQEWIVDLFLAQNTEDRSLVHRTCLGSHGVRLPVFLLSDSTYSGVKFRGKSGGNSSGKIMRTKRKKICEIRKSRI